MTAFEICVNGQKRFTAGGDAYQTLVTPLTLIRPPYPETDCFIHFGTSAVAPESATAAFWPECEILVGDRVEVRIKDADAICKLSLCGMLRKKGLLNFAKAHPKFGQELYA
jgi:hypothetical protein